MIINTGQRTDIPAFYAEWFARRLQEGTVCVRNPFDHAQVSRYRLSPDTVDLMVFCTKDPSGMFPYMDLLKDYEQYWFVTVTPYGREIERNVPEKRKVLNDFRILSEIVGSRRMCWRYDPILLNERYTKEYHLKVFEKMAKELKGSTETVVISFLDLYQKVKRNFPEAKEVSREDSLYLGERMIRIAEENGMILKTCAEGDLLAPYGADCRGCMTLSMCEELLGTSLKMPYRKPAREMCSCILTSDIGAYDSCGHLCRYCYANSDEEAVKRNMRRHDPASPFLIGNNEEGDRIHDVVSTSWKEREIRLF